MPIWVFPSVSGTALDGANVWKMLNRILVKADLHERGPHQLRHTYASLPLKVGAPITYVSQQLGHKDSYTTLKYYSHWLPDSTGERVVDRLDQTQPTATPAQPATGSDERDETLSALKSGMSRDGIVPERLRTTRINDSSASERS
jgi:integrase